MYVFWGTQCICCEHIQWSSPHYILLNIFRAVTLRLLSCIDHTANAMLGALQTEEMVTTALSAFDCLLVYRCININKLLWLPSFFSRLGLNFTCWLLNKQLYASVSVTHLSCGVGGSSILTSLLSVLFQRTVTLTSVSHVTQLETNTDHGYCLWGSVHNTHRFVALWIFLHELWWPKAERNKEIITVCTIYITRSLAVARIANRYCMPHNRLSSS